MKIIDFSNCKENNKAYGGMAGSKLGIIYENEDWLLKFPKTTRSMKGVDISYTTSPLSEYIGSHVYKILGYDVHETLLGIRDGKLVVACKDFTSANAQLQEFREVKNYYNHDLEHIMNHTISTSDNVGRTSLEAVKIHLEMNPLLNCISGMKERFWDCVVIDGLINNNDRNSGNWGVLRDHTGNIKLAPVFDNGASFSTKISEDQIENLLKDQERFYSSSTNTVTGYNLNGNSLNFSKLLKLDEEDLKRAILKNVPLIEQNWQNIVDMIHEIPSISHDLNIISESRRIFFIKGMELRKNHLLIPAFKELL